MEEEEVNIDFKKIIFIDSPPKHPPLIHPYPPPPQSRMQVAVYRSPPTTINKRSRISPHHHRYPQ